MKINESGNSLSLFYSIKYTDNSEHSNDTPTKTINGKEIIVHSPSKIGNNGNGTSTH